MRISDWSSYVCSSDLQLRNRLLRVPGVKRVVIIGERPERIFVNFSQERLATLCISPREIFAALNDQNLLTPAGSIESKGPQIQVRLDGAFDEIAKIGETPIVAAGRTLKPSDEIGRASCRERVCQYV